MGFFTHAILDVARRGKAAPSHAAAGRAGRAQLELRFCKGKSVSRCAMCNEAARRTALGLMREDFSQLCIPLIFPEGLPNLGDAPSIRITDSTVIVRATGALAAA